MPIEKAYTILLESINEIFDTKGGIQIWHREANIKLAVDLFFLAKGLFDAEQYYKTIDLLTLALEFADNIPELFLLRGHAFSKLMDFERAQVDYRIALENGLVEAGQYIK